VTDKYLKPISEKGFKTFGGWVEHYEEKYGEEKRDLFDRIYKHDITSKMLKTTQNNVVDEDKDKDEGE